ncbi:MAG TPA: cytochrome P450 [Pseudonocardia sp.]|nr:cytochrome P450 [Pseudonocardia sp.]
MTATSTPPSPSEFDPMSAEVAADPHPVFARMRETCPVHRHVLPSDRVIDPGEHPLIAEVASEFWSLFRYDDAHALFHDTDSYRCILGPGPEKWKPLSPEGMLNIADPPAHGKQRRIVLKAFAPRMIDHLEAVIRRRASELVEGLLERGEAEILHEFAIPLTAETIREYFGVEESRIDLIKRLGNDTIQLLGGDAAAVATAMATMNEAFEFLGGLVAQRAAALERGEQLPDDVLTVLMTTPYDETRTFTVEEILMASHALLTAGYETTSVAIANTTMLLATHPDQRAYLEADLSRVPAAVEEFLRFEPPIEEAFRTTATDIEIRGHPIPADTKIRAVISSANRDPAVFGDPDRLRLDRDIAETRKHLTFGTGKHACLGAALARMELRIAFETLLTRLPGFELHPAHSLERVPNLHTNGFRALWIRWDVDAARAART